MNERIKELAKQAFDTAEYPADQQYRIEPNSEFCKKFAQLIVQECVNVLHDNELWSRDVSHVFKEHFGVES